jgi:hypothetical protein
MKVLASTRSDAVVAYSFPAQVLQRDSGVSNNTQGPSKTDPLANVFWRDRGEDRSKTDPLANVL